MGGKHDKANHQEQASELKLMTLTGTIHKVEKKKKDGSVMMSWHVLTDEAGNDIHLPKGKADEYEGLKVKVTGSGYLADKKGHEVPVLKTVEAIEKIEEETK